MDLNYDEEHDLLYVKLKNCPNHYVDQLEDKYFDLWRDSATLKTKETQSNTKEGTK